VAQEYQTTLVPVDKIDDIWEDVQGLITKTSDEVLNETDIYQYLIEGTYRLFIIVEHGSNRIVTAYTTCFIDYPNHRACRIVTLGGSQLAEWYQHSITFVEQWAEEEECNFMEVYGRRGWAKVMKGYEEKCVLLRKTLTNKSDYENI
jgi:hypothetical protein